MPRGPYVEEQCPDCGAKFTASSKPNPVTGTNVGKVCPAGHWTRVDVLAACRKLTWPFAVPAKKAARPAPVQAPLLQATSSPSAALLVCSGLVDAFERLESQFPVGSKAHAMLVGVFLQPVVIAKKTLGRIA